jgi:hypothetical protein
MAAPNPPIPYPPNDPQPCAVETLPTAADLDAVAEEQQAAEETHEGSK